RAGDTVLGLASSGAHSNGYSLVRKILQHAGARPDQDLGGRPLGDVVMEPTRIYVTSVLAALAAHGAGSKGLAHITGGGLLASVAGILLPGLWARRERGGWQWAGLCRWLQGEGGVGDRGTAGLFSCGIGMVLVVDAA